MNKQIRVNIRSLANTSLVRSEKRNGRDVLIIPSATLPDDVIMNDIKYPAAEIARGFETLDRTPAPYGHPTINGQFVSARDPEGINQNYIGAWNENVRREQGRVFLDKVIDVEVANRSEDGKAVIDAINAGEPIHTSTGLLCNLAEPDSDDHKHIATNLYFDHDAILLNEEGAATPEQGVGMLVNGKEIEVVNSSIEWADRDLDWAVESAVQALEKRARVPVLERMKTAIIEAFASEREPMANEKELDMPVSEEQFGELSAKVDSLTESLTTINESVAEAVANAVKPLTDNLTELQANQKAKDEAEKSALVNKLVETGRWTEEEAGELTLNALKKLVDQAKPGKAAAVNRGGKAPNDDDEFAGYDMNAGITNKKDAA